MLNGWDVRTAVSKKEITGGQGESSFHVMARTGLGIPDQLSFLSSSVNTRETGRRGLQMAGKASPFGGHPPPVPQGARRPINETRMNLNENNFRY